MSEQPGPLARALYRGAWDKLVRWFRVPDAPPAPPLASADEKFDSFRPAEGFLRYLKCLFWIVMACVNVVLVFCWIASCAALISEDLWWVALLITPLFLIVIVVPDVVAYVAIHLRYDTTWYVMTDRSLRIRRGIWLLHETTITFENVQNLKVRQGPLQRLYGVSTLIVETAGAGAGHESAGLVANRGVVEGIQDAKALRDRILKRLRRSTSAGLGDDEGRAAVAWTPAHVEALREIHEAVRVLRA